MDIKRKEDEETKSVSWKVLPPGENDSGDVDVTKENTSTAWWRKIWKVVSPLEQTYLRPW